MIVVTPSSAARAQMAARVHLAVTHESGPPVRSEVQIDKEISMLEMSAWYCFEPCVGEQDAVRRDGAHEPSCETALRDCLVANYARLHRRLTRQLEDADLASDSLHDTWLRLGEASLAHPVCNPEAYVYRTACNVAMNRLRRSTAGRQPDEFEFEQVVDDAPGPERIAEARSAVASVDRAMQHLSRRHRTVLVALRIDELTRQEVAARYGLSLRNVDTTLRQALDHCAMRTGHPVLGGIATPRRAMGEPHAQGQRTP